MSINRLGNGKYEIIERLGRGGMAEVYKAYQTNLDRFVAIKILHAFLADDPEFKNRFEKEARNIAKLKHANIVQVYDFENDTDNESYYMVMELVDGPTLKEVLAILTDNEQMMAVEEAVRIIRESAGALSYAHNLNMIHRDVKPANLMLDSNNRVVLTDFGIAKIVTGVQFTASGGMVGTPAYMAPEQGLGEQGDERSDLYSLGIIFYQMLTGKLPYDGDTPLAVILKHLNEPVRSTREFREDVPETLDHIVMKLMAKDPNDRYQTATELIADLDRFERGLLNGEDTLGIGISARDVERDTVALPRRPTPADGTRLRDATNPPGLRSQPVGAGARSASPPKRQGLPLWLWVLFSILVGLGIWALVFRGGLGSQLLAGDVTATDMPTLAALVNASDTPDIVPTPVPPTSSPSDIPPTATPLPPTDTPTTQPTQTSRPTATERPTITYTPSITPTPSNTPTPTITPTATINLTATRAEVELAQTVQAMTLVACTFDYAVESRTLLDANGSTISDNSIQAGRDFTLEITLRNTGNCAWEINSSLRYLSGEFFDSEQVILIDRRVGVADTYTVQFHGRAPNKNGDSTGYWRLLTSRDLVIGREPLEITIRAFGA
ncbi:MAG: protein kinase [Anaerolineae bacterium]|nr:protein kinase [Anaerolineae bacterium]